ncbi:MAG: phosphate ABC transporter permease subunit PstC [Dysgonamonadaceae bacterium]|jgi:phosphate transport system permease protein|nr:phosphate ABC transporter permease subunit PstC [Dysgonamonadaceae bacterium]
MKDKIFQTASFISAAISLLLLVAIFFYLLSESLPAIKHFGLFDFISSTEWVEKEGEEHYGAGAFIIGTFLTATLALIISIPFSSSLTLLITEYWAETRAASFLNSLLLLCVNIPTIIWGIWGYFSLRPVFESLGIGSSGTGILTTSVALAIMITPTASLLSVSFASKIDRRLRETAYSLGATRFDIIRKISFPLARKSYLISYLFAFGKALGETLIVVMLIGNTNQIPQKITDTGSSLSSIILNQFESAGDLKFSSLVALGFILFISTALVNFTARYIRRVKV